jgi:hypothetical protein
MIVEFVACDAAQFGENRMLVRPNIYIRVARIRGDDSIGIEISPSSSRTHRELHFEDLPDVYLALRSVEAKSVDMEPAVERSINSDRIVVVGFAICGGDHRGRQLLDFISAGAGCT